jgi:GDP-4-dehydro-6-deoxy-D-mannose reductase
VINCAGATGRAGAAEAYALHVQGTLNLLEAVRRHVPEAAVVLLGSAAEYGEVDVLPTPENVPTRPTTFYGTSKLAQTHLAGVAAREWGLRVVVARLFNVIGPGLPERYFLAALAARLRSKGDTFPVDSMEATRDFLDVRDAARAITALVGIAKPGELEVVNVASGEEVSVGEAAAWLGQLAGGRVPVSSGRAGGVRRSCGDSAKLRALTGWLPRVGWRDSVAEMWRGGA